MPVGITLQGAPANLAVAAPEVGRPSAPVFDASAVAVVLENDFRQVPAPYDLPDGRFAGVGEGRAWRLEVGNGTVALRCWDPARKERRASENADDDRRFARPDSLSAWSESHSAGHIAGAVYGDASFLMTDDPGSILLRGGRTARSRVYEWSRKSRARMLRAYAELDYRPLNRAEGVMAMVTLTYPGEWESVAPTFQAVKGHLSRLRDRWRAVYGERPCGLWKLEFQGRGAPHFHLFVSVPALAPDPYCARHLTRSGRVAASCRCGTFERWLGWTWADIVGHADQGERDKHQRFGFSVDFGAASTCTDGRRLAVYFLKHGTKTRDGKEYQHTVPALWDLQADEVTGEVTSDGGTGRFWGYWGLERRTAVVDLPMADWYTLRRILRRWRASQGQSIRGLGDRGGNGGGWCLVNDGAGFAALLSRALAASR